MAASSQALALFMPVEMLVISNCKRKCSMVYFGKKVKTDINLFLFMSTDSLVMLHCKDKMLVSKNKQNARIQ